MHENALADLACRADSKEDQQQRNEAQSDDPPYSTHPHLTDWILH
jgi:hypothetical protein